ncbi:HEAT repeat domain-containing protein [candidate division KSB1 bacterium]|nr:HEAT repeat domain-containing protein [candidate division KSB1 bacterium]
MKKCNYTQQVYFYIIDELDEAKKTDLEQHLATCPQCQQEKENLTCILSEYNAMATFEPDEATLRTLRNVVSLKLKVQKTHRTTFGSLFTTRSFILPLQYITATIILVAFGFLLGRFNVFDGGKKNSILQTLLTGEQQVQTLQSDIVPYLVGIDRVKFNPASGQVEIKYNTVNDISYRGNSQNPIVREVLRRAITEETSPNIRMQAVKTLGAIAEQNRHLDPEFLQAIEYLLHEEQNVGVRLMALRVLKSVPLSETVKKMLVRILLYDEVTAVRIQAFETLTGRQAPTEEMKSYLLAAQKDTSSYIRYKAGELLNRIENNKVGEISREE